MDHYLEQIKTFISDFWYEIDITKYSRIEEDLHITGDDAVEFLVEFSKRFDVDISEFKADEYFESEGFSLIDNFTNRFSKGQKRKLKSLTIHDLIEAIKSKKLH